MPPELPVWYAEWVKSHLVAFAILTDENVAAFASWFPAFRAMGVDRNELGRATFAVLNGTALPFKTADHYLALKLAVASDRAAVANRKDVQGDDRSVCDDCGDSGYSTVPHSNYCDAIAWRPVRHNEQGNPVYATCAVICRCWKGRKFNERQQAEHLDDSTKPVRMTIGEYEERVNDNWREQVRQRKAKERELANAEMSVPANSKEFLSNLAARFAAGGKR